MQLPATTPEPCGLLSIYPTCMITPLLSAKALFRVIIILRLQFIDSLQEI